MVIGIEMAQQSSMTRCGFYCWRRRGTYLLRLLVSPLTPLGLAGGHRSRTQRSVGRTRVIGRIFHAESAQAVTSETKSSKRSDGCIMVNSDHWSSDAADSFRQSLARAIAVLPVEASGGVSCAIATVAADRVDDG